MSGDAAQSEAEKRNKIGSAFFLIRDKRLPLETAKKVGKGRVAVDFGLGQGASEAAIPIAVLPERATQAKAKRRATLRARAGKAIWRRCASVTDHSGYAPSPRHHHMAFPARARPFPTFFTVSLAKAVRRSNPGRPGRRARYRSGGCRGTSASLRRRSRAVCKWSSRNPRRKADSHRAPRRSGRTSHRPSRA